MLGAKRSFNIFLFRCLVDNRAKLNTITIPMLILHGQNDSLCNVVGSHTLHEVTSILLYKVVSFFCL